MSDQTLNVKAENSAVIDTKTVAPVDFWALLGSDITSKPIEKFDLKKVAIGRKTNSDPVNDGRNHESLMSQAELRTPEGQARLTELAPLLSGADCTLKIDSVTIATAAGSKFNSRTGKTTVPISVTFTVGGITLGAITSQPGSYRWLTTRPTHVIVKMITQAADRAVERGMFVNKTATDDFSKLRYATISIKSVSGEDQTEVDRLNQADIAALSSSRFGGAGAKIERTPVGV